MRLTPLVLCFLPTVAIAAPSSPQPKVPAVLRAKAPASPLSKLDPSKLPAECRALATLPPSAKTAEPDFAAHLSVANCLAEVAMSKLTPSPDAAGIAALDAAVQPSLAMLREVATLGDARWKLVADDSIGDLDISLMVRLRTARELAAIPPDALEPALEPWHTAAIAAFRSAAQIADAHPDVAKSDPVVAAAANEARRAAAS